MKDKTPLLVEYSDLIKLLTTLSPKKRSQLISQLKGREINCLSEIVSNFLQKRLTTNPNVIEKLRKYRNDLKIVAKKKTPIYLKKKIYLSRRGGAILTTLLPLAVSLLSSIIG